MKSSGGYRFTVSRMPTGQKVLTPALPYDAEWFDKIGEGTELSVSDETSKPSARARRFYWALLGKVCDNHPFWSDKEALSEYLKIGVGFVRYVIWPDGSVHTYPRSIADAGCTYGMFREFLDKAVDMIVVRVMPGLERGKLLKEVEKMCGVSYSSIMNLSPDEQPPKAPQGAPENAAGGRPPSARSQSGNSRARSRASLAAQAHRSGGVGTAPARSEPPHLAGQGGAPDQDDRTKRHVKALYYGGR
jgi:hypothetical protein